MKPFCIALFVVASIMAASSSPGGYRVARIEITQPAEGQTSNLPAVHGQRSCGGPGQVLQWRFEPCTGEGVCQVPGDDNFKRPSELDFIPSQDSSALGVRVILVNDGSTNTVYEKAISDSAVQGGQRYTVNGLGGAKADMKGRTVTVQYVLYRVDTGDVEVCTEADFEIV
ncbi:hypothetical protein Ocin01_13065 [Orchesella cincta]|uniref:Uncharacterized protein n=1 Tax=Orchesella cincta TaxID=48709 RepID=A0A1D2ML32_ORCCI|nr:hypothetical protein Ocin01_13065 [Orchesella cincta]